MKKLLAYSAIALMALTGTAQADGHAKIKIATEGAYAPWNFKDSAGNLVGFEVELANDLCARMKADCTIVEQAWDGIIPALKAGKYDAIMAGMSLPQNAKKVITFSRSYADEPGSFVVLKSDGNAGFNAGVEFIDLTEVDAGEKAGLAAITKAFKGKSIGVQGATTHENFLREYLGNDADIRSYDTQENLDLDLQAGRVDAALASMSYWRPLIESDKGKDLVAVGPGLTGGPFGKGVGAGIRKEDQALADKFSKAIDAAIADGTIKKLALKWFGFDASAK